MAEHMLSDKAYDSAELREELDEQGTNAIIPNRSNRKLPSSFNKCLYKLRWRVQQIEGLQAHRDYDRLARN
jgi:IS5 family transposase